MAKTDYKNIDQYHKAQPSELRGRLEQIRDVIHKVVPNVEEVISYQIPCFKYYGYLIYYASFPNHTSLSYPYSAALLKAFAGELKRYKVSKSAIQFPVTEPLPLTLIKGIVEFRKKENEMKAEITHSKASPVKKFVAKKTATKSDVKTDAKSVSKSVSKTAAKKVARKPK